MGLLAVRVVRRKFKRQQHKYTKKKLRNRTIDTLAVGLTGESQPAYGQAEASFLENANAGAESSQE